MKGRFGLVGKVLKDTAAQAKASVNEAAEEAAKRKALRDAKSAAKQAWAGLMVTGFPKPGEDMTRIYDFLEMVKKAAGLEEQNLMEEATEAWAAASPFGNAELAGLSPVESEAVAEAAAEAVVEEATEAAETAVEEVGGLVEAAVSGGDEEIVKDE